ncbi:MAG: CAAX protease [Synechococcales cyanobacterium M58_A2018_015]|nr:CAAX protease [Synechococcales cyanobacterium M58_A2018_015]
MTETAWNQAYDLLGGAFALQTEAFRQIARLPHGLELALLVVLLAGLSLSIGQMIILFINRVKPARFIFSLLLNAILFATGFLFLVLSTWLICLLPWSVYVPFWTLVAVLGLSYAPELFGFLGALPYLGQPLLSLLSVWRLLAMVVGFAAAANVGSATAFGYVVFGWVVLQLLETTIGQPIARFGKMIADRVAGVNLASRRSEIAELLQTRFATASSPMVPASQAQYPEVRQFIAASNRSHPEAAQAVAQAVVSQSSQSARLGTSSGTFSTVARSTASANGTASTAASTVAPPVTPPPRTPVRDKIQWLLTLLGMGVLFVLITLLMRPVRDSLFGWYMDLPELFRWVFYLFWIAVLAVIFAGLLAPLEALGWWAGWYGDDIMTVQPTVMTLPEETPSATRGKGVSRYVVYLDGIGQSGEEYTPDVEDFLRALHFSMPWSAQLVRGLMMYSVLNKPLYEDRPLAFIWRLADKLRWQNPAALLGLLLNLRNVLIVAVSADRRYGPIYNQGIAQVIYNGLIEQGYPLGSDIPITLIGYSGGAEMSVAAAPYLKRAIDAPIDVISLGGVISANNNILVLEHLYHLVGSKDIVERIGPIMFPGRWPIFPLSYWNRAKRRGKISIVPLGPMGHQVPGGMMDPEALLPDGRSHLQHTIEVILQILSGKLLLKNPPLPQQPSNYELYKQLPFNDPTSYPLRQSLDPQWYRPIGTWMGRLILPQPEEREEVRGVWFEVYHTDAGCEHLVGQVVKLRWINDPTLKSFVRSVTRDVHFSSEAEYTSTYKGLVHPERLNHWQRVGPLESLAGSHPVDDIVVMLAGEVRVERDSLLIRQTPVQITGRYYGLVQFVEPQGSDRFRVVHFNRQSQQFDGREDVVALPPVRLAEAYGSYPSTTRDLERSPLNEMGWYIYGTQDATGIFVVQALAPRALFRLQPDRVVFGQRAAYRYVRQEAWADAAAQKGRISSVLCTCREDNSSAAIQAAINEWQEGDRALVVHVYGGIGGKKKEPAAATPIFFGHFSYGVARVVREPLTGELRFDIQYYQVYTHNTDGLVAGVLHWSRYLGDRQFGWMGTRPVCDILIKLDAFTDYYDINGSRRSPLDTMLTYLEVMTARYRIGDGTGGTYVNAVHNCTQDSNQAFFYSLRQVEKAVRAQQNRSQHRRNDQLASQGDHVGQSFEQLMRFQKALKLKLQPIGGVRKQWEKNEFDLGNSIEDHPLRTLIMGLGSWRTILPRLASDTVVHTFLRHNATIWVLRTNQIGGYDPDIEPVVPMTL